MANPAANITIIEEAISMVSPQKYINPNRSTKVNAMQVNTQKTVTKSATRIKVTLMTAPIVRHKLRINSLLITCGIGKKNYLN